MQTIRNSRWMTNLVLVWFALLVSSSIATTYIKPGSLQMVCSGSGVMKLLDTSDNQESNQKSPHAMDCPLCISVIAPPCVLQNSFEKPSPLAFALRPIAAAHIAFATAPPLPSRGPPITF